MIQSMCRIRTHAPHDVKTCFRRKMQFPFWHQPRGSDCCGIWSGDSQCWRPSLMLPTVRYAHCKSTRNATLLLLYYKLQRYAGGIGRLTPSQKKCKYRGPKSRNCNSNQRAVRAKRGASVRPNYRRSCTKQMAKWCVLGGERLLGSAEWQMKNSSLIKCDSSTSNESKA